MPRYKILPIDPSHSSAEIVSLDAGAVLSIIGQLNCLEADVLEDGVYSCSVRLGGNGMWTIFQRHASDDAPVQKYG